MEHVDPRIEALSDDLAACVNVPPSHWQSGDRQWCEYVLSQAAV